MAIIKIYKNNTHEIIDQTFIATTDISHAKAAATRYARKQHNLMPIYINEYHESNYNWTHRLYVILPENHPEIQYTSQRKYYRGLSNIEDSVNSIHYMILDMRTNKEIEHDDLKYEKTKTDIAKQIQNDAHNIINITPNFIDHISNSLNLEPVESVNLIKQYVCEMLIQITGSKYSAKQTIDDYFKNNEQRKII